MSELFETAIVEKRNLLNELRTSLNSTQELRLFSVYLSKIDPYDSSTRIVRFSLSDFQRIMNFEQLNIARLKASASKVLHSEVFLPKESGGFKGINLFETFDVDKDSNGVWYVEINPTQTALPLLFDFKDKYFKYELWNALRLKAPSQIRMYEILKQYEKIGKREIEVNKLQELLGVNYARWDRFKAKVLDNCQKALKEVTDICYTYERGKTGAGGKWLTIVFYIKANNEYVDPISLDQYIEQNPKFTEPEFDTPTEFNCDSDLSVLIDKAFKSEFSSDDIQELHDLVCKAVPENDNKARVQYFLEKYRKMKSYNPNKKLNYLKTIIENDIQNKGDSPSYDLGDYEKFARNYDFSDCPWNVKTENEKS